LRRKIQFRVWHIATLMLLYLCLLHVTCRNVPFLKVPCSLSKSKQYVSFACVRIISNNWGTLVSRSAETIPQISKRLQLFPIKQKENQISESNKKEIIQSAFVLRISVTTTPEKCLWWKITFSSIQSNFYKVPVEIVFIQRKKSSGCFGNVND